VIVEIVPARRKGVTGYVSVGRGSRWGNPYVVGVHGDAGECVREFAECLRLLNEVDAPRMRDAGIAALARRATDGLLRIACPCNGLFADPPAPCHSLPLAQWYAEAVGGEVRIWKSGVAPQEMRVAITGATSGATEEATR
jgi:hypothetical protein